MTDYTFANFVVGSSNQLAHAAALAVAQAPGRAYNPLFLYGGRGVGKTHLLQAIAHHLRQQDATRRVVYTTAEQFVAELRQALQQLAGPAFRERYRQVDVFLCDDVHVLAGKRHAQEEFFHTFNALYEAGRQIVLAGDRPPQEITALEARLRSRFAAGLLADLQPPDLETRLAILCRKAEACGVRLPHEAALCIASPLHDVRDLERCLRRLVTHASLHAGTITPELATTVVEQLQAERAQAITAPRIQHAVAAYFGLRAGELTSKSRQRTVTFPRQIAMFLCRELTGASLPEIGQHFGGKDHTTVLHACTKIARLEEEDARVARILQQLRHTLGGPL